MRACRTALVVVVLVALTSGCKGSTGTGDKLADIRDKGFGAAGPLFPKRPWKVTYAWDCAKQLSEGRNVLQEVRVVVTHADDGSYVDHDYLTKGKGPKGKGVLSYDRPGAYVVSITTDCDFQLRVNQVRKNS